MENGVGAEKRPLSLADLCSGLPLDPLPPPQTARESSVPHAPSRTPGLTREEKKVCFDSKPSEFNISCFHNNIILIAGVEELPALFPVVSTLYSGTRVCCRTGGVWTYLHVQIPSCKF